jgi:hypothetical protein
MQCGAAQQDGLVDGIFAATPVATPQGWRAAAALCPGDLVLSVGSGPVAVCAVSTAILPHLTLQLPQGALGNRSPIELPPAQLVLLETDQALQMCGTDLILLPALAFDGWRGIALQNLSTPNPLLQLVLARPEVIYAGPGLLLACPGAEDALPPLPSLSLATARQLVACLIAYDLGRSLRAAQAAF